MSYTYTRYLPDVNIDDADMRVREALKQQGFGVLTEIDVQQTMKTKIDVDMDGYRMRPSAWSPGSARCCRVT